MATTDYGGTDAAGGAYAGTLGDYLQRAKDAAGDKLRAVLTPDAISPMDPAREALYSNVNPLAKPLIRGALQATASGMDQGQEEPGLLKRGLQLASGSSEVNTPPAGAPAASGAPAQAPAADGTAHAPTFVPFTRGPDAPPAPTAASSTGGGGGGIDRSKLTAAEAAYEARFGEGASATRQKYANDVEVQKFTSEQEANQAERARTDAEDRRARDQIAFTKQKEFLDRQEYLANDLANKKVDPSRLLRNADAGTQFTIGLGATIAGGLAAMNRQDGNSSLDRLNKMIDRDIDAQKEDIKAGRASYDARNSLFTQMLAEHRDEGIAEDATRVALYKATADKIRSDAARIGLPGVMAAGEIAANKFETQAAELKYKMEKDSYDKKVSQAAAAVSAARAEKARQEELQYKYSALDVTKRGQDLDAKSKGAVLGQAAAQSDNERFVATGADPTGAPTGYLARSKEEAAKTTEALGAAKTLLNLIDRSQKIRKEHGALERTFNREDKIFGIPDWQRELQQNEKHALVLYGVANHLGSLDTGVERVGDKTLGQWDSRFGSSDTSLENLRRNTEAAIKAHTETGGQKVSKAIDPRTGAEFVVRGKGFNSPLPDWAEGEAK